MKNKKITKMLNGKEVEIVESIPWPKEKMEIAYYMRVAEQSLDEQVDLRKEIERLEKELEQANKDIIFWHDSYMNHLYDESIKNYGNKRGNDENKKK